VEILACVPRDEERAAAVLAEADRLAAELKASVCVVHLYPGGWKGPVRAHPSAWHLITDQPAAAVRRFAALRRFSRVVC
jgi:hypothetical protein